MNINSPETYLIVESGRRTLEIVEDRQAQMSPSELETLRESIRSAVLGGDKETLARIVEAYTG